MNNTKHRQMTLKEALLNQLTWKELKAGDRLTNLSTQKKWVVLQDATTNVWSRKATVKLAQEEDDRFVDLLTLWEDQDEHVQTWAWSVDSLAE